MQPSKKTGQLPLQLSTEPSDQRADLVESESNAMAISMIDAWPDWPGNLMILAGPVGSGKSHIAGAWIASAGGLVCDAEKLGESVSAIHANFEAGGHVVIEDAGPGKIDETALFHIINAARQSKAYCLITSRNWPLEWQVTLPDLLSRLRAAQVVELREPDDALLKAVMFKLFSDRQLSVDEKVLDYCVVRMERSLASAARLVETMDAEALSRQAPLSRSTAALALEALGMN